MPARETSIGHQTAEKIVALREQWHTKNHPFYLDFFEGKIGIKEMGVLMAQHYHHAWNVGPYVAYAYVKAPEDGKLPILSNMAEEAGLIAGPGEDRKPLDHFELILRFTRVAGMTDDEVKATIPLPGFRARSFYHIHVLREEPFAVIVAMQATMEGQQPAINGERTLPAFQKYHGYKLDDPAIEFFTEHYLADADHSNRAIELVARHITSEDLANRALTVAQIQLRNRWDGMTDVYQACVSNIKRPLPKGVSV
jgi:pyrroloquinoline quinone (PQQ) biosynthesis protein C